MQVFPKQKRTKNRFLRYLHDRNNTVSQIVISDNCSWQVETALSSEDYGKDLASVQNLLRKHQLIEVDISAHEERITTLTNQCKHFIEIEHFDAVKITEKHETIVKRFEKITVMRTTRRTKLEQSLALHQFYRDIDDEESWIK